ncbi:hypothetical protein F5141DRAFT_996178 [Pisolithus sp. B1]|nr:hypothetical protein F5141DRAFT_996178 [Pisolithus sp. B1]
METKVKSIVKHCTCSTTTTLRSPQKCSQAVTQSPVATTTPTTTLLSPPSTLTSCKSKPSSTFVTSHPSVPCASTSCIAVIPHPSDLAEPTSKPEGFYLVIIGQEVSIFYTWKDAALWVLEISGAVYYKCKTFQQALANYTAAYNNGELHAIPTPGGPFWPTVLCMPSPTLSEGEQSYWAKADDLTDVLSQVQLNPAGSQ